MTQADSKLVALLLGLFLGSGLVPDVVTAQLLPAGEGDSASRTTSTAWSTWPRHVVPEIVRPEVRRSSAFGVYALPASLGALQQSVAASIGPGNAALRSAVIPGMGQLALGQRRGWAYLGLEALGWVLYVERRGAGSDLRAEYRDFAWREGRIQAGARIDGDFDYYETLSKWDGSGAFDLDANLPGLQPENDPTLYNGLIWTRGLGIFSADPSAGPGDPQYDAALVYYQEKAYGTGFLWDWTGSSGARVSYGNIIRSSDERFRQARNAMGLVIANHLASTVDAFLSARTRRLALQSRVLPGPAGRGFTVATSLQRRNR